MFFRLSPLSNSVSSFHGHSILTPTMAAIALGITERSPNLQDCDFHVYLFFFRAKKLSQNTQQIPPHGLLAVIALNHDFLRCGEKMEIRTKSKF